MIDVSYRLATSNLHLRFPTAMKSACLINTSGFSASALFIKLITKKPGVVLDIEYSPNVFDKIVFMQGSFCPF